MKKNIKPTHTSIIMTFEKDGRRQRIVVCGINDIAAVQASMYVTKEMNGWEKMSVNVIDNYLPLPKKGYRWDDGVWIDSAHTQWGFTELLCHKKWRVAFDHGYTCYFHSARRLRRYMKVEKGDFDDFKTMWLGQSLGYVMKLHSGARLHFTVTRIA